MVLGVINHELVVVVSFRLRKNGILHTTNPITLVNIYFGIVESSI